MIEYEMHPLPTPPPQKEKILWKLSKRDGFCTFKFLKEWMDTLLSLIPIRVFLVDRSKSYYRFWQNSW